MKQKLTSRKFWSLLTVLITCMFVLFGADSETITEVTALVTALGTTIVYLFVQGKLDNKDIDEDQQHH